MKLATTIGDFEVYTSNQLEAIKYCREAGFTHLDYSFGADFRGHNQALGDDYKNYVTEVLRLCDKLGCDFVQSHAPMGLPIVKNENYDSFISANLRCIEVCGMLNIPNIVVHSGYRYYITKEQCFEENKEFYQQLLPTAEKYGVTILTENFNRMCVDNVYWVDNAADEAELIDYVNHPLLQACYDTGHGNMNPTLPHEALAILGSRVKALHVQDNFGDDDSHFAPFFGTLNLDSLMHGLADIGYKGYFTLEADNLLAPGYKRRKYDSDTRLLQAPISIKLHAESLMHEIGKYILESYNAYED